MFRSWIIADGPANLSLSDSNVSFVFTIIGGGDPSPIPVTILIHSVGPMHGGKVKSITGRMRLGKYEYDITGNYHTTDHTGSCHTTDT